LPNQWCLFRTRCQGDDLAVEAFAFEHLPSDGRQSRGNTGGLLPTFDKRDNYGPSPAPYPPSNVPPPNRFHKPCLRWPPRPPGLVRHTIPMLRHTDARLVFLDHAIVPNSSRTARVSGSTSFEPSIASTRQAQNV